MRIELPQVFRTFDFNPRSEIKRSNEFVRLAIDYTKQEMTWHTEHSATLPGADDAMSYICDKIEAFLRTQPQFRSTNFVDKVKQYMAIPLEEFCYVDFSSNSLYANSPLVNYNPIAEEAYCWTTFMSALDFTINKIMNP